MMPYRDPAKRLEWQRAHPENCRAWKRRYREKHPEKVREQKREQRRKYREKHRAPAPLRVVSCGVCSATFETRGCAKYCSPDCAKVAKRGQRREWAMEHKQQLNARGWERQKRRHARDRETVRAQRRERQRRYREKHRETVRLAGRMKKRRRDAWLKSLTVEEIVRLVNLKGENEWPRTLLQQLLRRINLKLKEL
jgi:hypothetical protein